MTQFMTVEAPEGFLRINGTYIWVSCAQSERNGGMLFGWKKKYEKTGTMHWYITLIFPTILVMNVSHVYFPTNSGKIGGASTIFPTPVINITKTLPHLAKFFIGCFWLVTFSATYHPKSGRESQSILQQIWFSQGTLFLPFNIHFLLVIRTAN